MRFTVEDVLTPDQAANLAKTVGYLDFSDPRISDILDHVRFHFPISIEGSAYCRVESRPEGHPWHADAGNKHGGTRGWCRYSASVLLSPINTFTGGGLCFREDPEIHILHYLDLLMWDGDEEHCVIKSRGGRRSLIMFFEGT